MLCQFQVFSKVNQLYIYYKEAFIINSKALYTLF